MRGLVVLLAASAAALGRPPSLDDVRRLLRVDCTADALTATLHFHPNARLPPPILNAFQASARISATSTSCKAVTSDTRAALSLRIPLGPACTSVSNDSAAVVYEAKIRVMVLMQADSEHSFNLEIQCIHPAASEAWGPLLMGLAAFPTSDPKAHPLDPLTKLKTGDSLYLQPLPSLPWYHEDDVFSLPVFCWSSASAQADPEAADRTEVLVEGCPALSRARRGLSALSRRRGGATRVALTLGPALLPKANPSRFFFHCAAVPCTHSPTRALKDIPKCPASHFCAGKPSVSHALPAYVRSAPRGTASFGPVELAAPSRSALADEPSRALADIGNVHNVCRDFCLEQLAEERARREWQESLVIKRSGSQDGISLPVTVFVAVGSFVAGLVLMAMLRFIHDRYPLEAKPSVAEAALRERTPLTDLTEKMEVSGEWSSAGVGARSGVPSLIRT